MLLAQIPLDIAYYSVLDLKDAFFCIPLHPKSQPISAFEDPQESLDRSFGLSSHRDSEKASPLWVSSNPRLGRMAISTNYSATICR
jgi:hypothetical protein